jgi:hypothetical protein
MANDKNFKIKNGLNATRYLHGKNALTASTIDLSKGTYFTKTLSAFSLLTISNPPPSGKAMSFVLELTGGGSTIVYPSSVKFSGGSAPTAPASGEKDLICFITSDGGTNYYATLARDALG